MRHSAVLPIAWIALRILIALNWFGGVMIFALLTATIVAQDWTFRALGITPESGIPQMIMGLRAIAALGLVGVLFNNAVLTRLRKMVETVRLGDPFIADNAYRLNAIAWFLVALQLLSLVIAAVGRTISTPQNPVALDAGFSVNGWLAVILTFVLARVFAEGTLMREDLEGTI
jgi:hypothetical protein